MLQVALGKRDRISVFGSDYPTPDGTCIRDYIHVEDLADAHLSSLKKLQDGDRWIACNLGTGKGASVLELIQAAREVTGHEIPVHMADRRPGDPPELVSGDTRAKELLSWTPKRIHLVEIVRDAWRFHREFPQGFATMGP